MSTVVIGSDHAGFPEKEMLKSKLVGEFTFTDKGTNSAESTDYPDYAHEVANEVLATNGVGILLCGSGNGVCMTANKHAGIRAALCWTPKIAALARQHNNANAALYSGAFRQCRSRSGDGEGFPFY